MKSLSIEKGSGGFGTSQFGDMMLAIYIQHLYFKRLLYYIRDYRNGVVINA